MRKAIRPFVACLALATLTASAQDAAVSASANGVEVAKKSSPAAAPATPATSTCVNRCNAAEAKCSSEVRRARQECAKRVATGGRDPFTGRNEDYTSFCGYFSTGVHCGSDGRCRDRYAQRHGLCISRMQDNIASQRHDCVRSERDAQTFCRDELQDCKAQCEGA